jgi:hypothetical protein
MLRGRPTLKRVIDQRSLLSIGTRHSGPCVKGSSGQLCPSLVGRKSSLKFILTLVPCPLDRPLFDSACRVLGAIIRKSLNWKPETRASKRVIIRRKRAASRELYLAYRKLGQKAPAVRETSSHNPTANFFFIYKSGSDDTCHAVRSMFPAVVVNRSIAEDSLVLPSPGWRRRRFASPELTLLVQ